MDSIYLSRDACKDVLERLTVFFYMGCVCVVLSLTLLTYPSEQWSSNSSGVCWAQHGHPAQCPRSKVTAVPRIHAERQRSLKKTLGNVLQSLTRVNSRWGEGHGTQAAFITTNCSLFYQKWDPESLNIRPLESLGHKVSCGSLHRREELTAREAQTWSDSWISVMILILFLTYTLDMWRGYKFSSLFHLPLWQPCFFLSSEGIQSD